MAHYYYIRHDTPSVRYTARAKFVLLRKIRNRTINSSAINDTKTNSNTTG